MFNRLFRVIFILIVMFIILCGYYFLNLCFGISLSCLFYKITGYYCPGCGITRCLFAIINGDFYRAYCYNRLVFMMLPFITFYVIYNIYLYVMDKKDNIINKIPNYVWYVLLFIVILFGIVRNIDF